MERPQPRGEAPLTILLSHGALGAWPDADLLDLFESGTPGSEHAFATLVERHGPLVLRVARGRLDSEADARDAFQATFWLLARRSRSIRNRAGLGSWLFGVAARVAARARVESIRRRVREQGAAVAVADSTLDPAQTDPDLPATVQAEVARLPGKYRLAVVLCDLEGLSYAEAATRLGCPVGTFKAQLARGRARLRDRLARRGLAPAGWESSPARPLSVPFALLQATCRLALDANPSHLTAASATILTLTRGVFRTMILSSISPWALVVAATGLAAGASILIAPTLGEPVSPPATVPPRPVAAVVEPEQQSALAPIGQAPQATPAGAAVPPPPEQPPTGPALAAVAGPVVGQIAADAAVLPDRAEQARLLLRLGRWQTRQGDRDAARATLAQARVAAETIPLAADGSLPWTIIQVGEAQADNGDSEVARQTFDATIPLVHRLPAERMEEFFNVLLAAERRTLPRAACLPTIQAYRMYQGYGGMHMTRTVLNWGARPASFGGACEGGIVLLGYGTPKLAEAAAALEGDFPRALRRIDAVWTSSEGLARPDGKLEALTAIAQALRPEDGPLISEVIGKVRQAIRTAPAGFGPSQCLLILMDVATRLGRWDEAAALALQVRSSSNPGTSNESTALLAHNLMDLIAAQAAAGDLPGARKLVRETTVLIQSAGGPSMQQPTLVIQFAPLLARVGDLDLALDLAGSLPLYEQYVALHRVLRDRQAAGATDDVRQVRDRLIAVVRQALATNEGYAVDMSKTGIRESWLIRLAGLTADPADIEAARAGVAAFAPAMQQRYFPLLAAALARAGQFAAAIATADRLTGALEQGQTLLAILTIELDRVRPATTEVSPHEWPWMDSIR